MDAKNDTWCLILSSRLKNDLLSALYHTLSSFLFVILLVNFFVFFFRTTSVQDLSGTKILSAALFFIADKCRCSSYLPQWFLSLFQLSHCVQDSQVSGTSKFLATCLLVSTFQVLFCESEPSLLQLIHNCKLHRGSRVGKNLRKN